MSCKNFLYDEKKDILYIMVYELGKGASSKVWYGLEIEKFHFKMKNKEILKMNPRALKIHNESSYHEGMTETEISKLFLESNKKKSPYINYPLNYFIYDESIVIIVYELAIGSLYDVIKMFDRKLPLDFVYKIIPQLVAPINLVHNEGYIFTDIKPENYLLMGLNKIQSDICEWANKYSLGNRLRKVSGIKKFKVSNVYDNDINEPLKIFIKSLSKKFKLKQNIIYEDSDDSDDYNSSNNSENYDSENEDNNDYEQNLTEDNVSLYSFYSCISDAENEDDYDVVSSYDSRNDEYFNYYDNFHTKSIITHLFEYKKNKLDEKKNTNEKKSIKLNKKKYPIWLLENPKIKLTDFGMIKHISESKCSVQTRYYRAPEVIIGLDYDYNIDLWSLGCTIYDLLFGDVLFYTCKNELIYKYDLDLVHIKMIFEKINEQEQKKLINMISTSNRKLHFLNKYECLNYFSELKSQPIENDIYCNVDDDINLNVKSVLNIDNITTIQSQKTDIRFINILSFIIGLLKINPLERDIKWKG